MERDNHFSPEDIKNSVEYRWRKQLVQTYLLIWLLIAIVSFSFSLIMDTTNHSLLGPGLIISLVWSALTGAICLPFALHSYRKMAYLLKNYPHFHAYEVVLDQVSTSYAYRHSLFYTVTINDNGTKRQAETNPCFSSSFFSDITCEEYNNRHVVGLYDPQLNKFYIICRTN